MAKHSERYREALKAAGVELVEVRLALGLGGKAFATVTGEVSDVAAAVEAATELASARGMLTEAVVIPAPAAGLAEFTI